MPDPASGTTSSNRNVMIVLAYLWLLALVPLLVEKDDPEVQWHAKHGLVLVAAEVICWIALTIVSMILGAISTALGCLFAFVPMALLIAVVIVHIMAIVKGINGQRLIIPGVSEYANRF
jgi:uncharacterized membrane protein